VLRGRGGLAGWWLVAVAAVHLIGRSRRGSGGLGTWEKVESKTPASARAWRESRETVRAGAARRPFGTQSSDRLL
jgi:hypothetical protein